MSLKIYHFKLPFVQPLVTAKGSFSSRIGILISATIDGRTCWGEVSPLPGFSATTLDDCLEWFNVNISSFRAHLLESYRSFLEKNTIQDTIQAIASTDEPNFPKSTPPEICFAFDTLLFQAISQRSDLNPPSKITLGVNATASDLNTAQSKIQNGYNTIKLKVGLDWPREINTILILRSQNPDIRLRLDANESWDVSEAKLRLQELQNLNIEYIEQPVNQADLQKHGYELRLHGIPIAADESARSLKAIQVLIQERAADVFILKPTMLGSFRVIKDVCNEIKSAGSRIVFTSSLDSSLNVSMAAFLASVWADPEDMHGFSTGSLFEKDINPTKPEISDSKLTIDTSWIINPELTLDRTLIASLS